jgi:hypothetical protein
MDEEILGYQTHSKWYKWFYYDVVNYIYSKNFGMTRHHSSHEFGEHFRYLKGCVIDGIVYGDTTIVTNQ